MIAFDNCQQSLSLSFVLRYYLLMVRKDPLERLAAMSPFKFKAELFAISLYKGEPRKELDEAWEKLVNRTSSANAHVQLA